MKMPREFRRISENFFNGIHLVAPSLDEMVKFTTARLLEPEKAVVVAYLDELLSGSHDDKALQDVWFKSSADIYFPKPGELRQMLTKMREHLTKVD